jgi:5'-3' exonuclease
MGIKSNFNSLIKKLNDDIFRIKHISDFAYKQIAIDISLFIHKFKSICNDKWLLSILRLIMCLRKYNVHCVFIFDGLSPPEKQKEREKRKTDKERLINNISKLEDALKYYYETHIIKDCLIELYNKYNKDNNRTRLLTTKGPTINMKWVEYKIEQKKKQILHVIPNDFKLVKELLDICKIPYYTADGEAEKLCAHLCIIGKVSAVLSDDTDILAYQTPISLSKINILNGNITCVYMNDLLNGIEMDTQQFTDLCIMCGTDYNTNIPGIGGVNAYRYLKKYNSIEQINKEMSIDISCLNHERVRVLFNEFEKCYIENIPYCGKPNFNKLHEFMIKRNIFIDINQIKNPFINQQLIFEN